MDTSLIKEVSLREKTGQPESIPCKVVVEGRQEERGAPAPTCSRAVDAAARDSFEEPAFSEGFDACVEEADKLHRLLLLIRYLLELE
jgi:hypothetical protein